MSDCRLDRPAIEWRAVERCKVTALRIATENVRMLENNLQKTGVCTLRCNGVLECTNTDVTSEQVVTSEMLSVHELSLEPTRVEERLAVQLVSSLEMRLRGM